MQLTLCTCCMNKYVLHIPRVKVVDGEAVEITRASMALAMDITKEIDGCYFIDAVGYYDGKLYDEKLMVVYSDKDIGELFKSACEKYHVLLGQKEYAYEKDNNLIKFKIS